MAYCPFCGRKSDLVLKEWDYGWFHVKNFNCKKCKKTFKAYYRHGKLTHIITQSPSIRSKIMKYLSTHSYATEFEIAGALHTPVKDIVNMLQKLEKEGNVSSFY